MQGKNWVASYKEVVDGRGEGFGRIEGTISKGARMIGSCVVRISKAKS